MVKDPADQNEASNADAGEVLPFHTIPEDLLRKWIDLPSNATINVPTTKFDVDQLFFAISNTQSAIDETNRAFVQWTNGNVADAQQSMERSRRNLYTGVNSLRQFLHLIAERMLFGAKDA